jgi:hypothetical protein
MAGGTRILAYAFFLDFCLFALFSAGERLVFFSWSHSFEVRSVVWALIRVRDEPLFAQMLDSIEPLFYHGVIAWQAGDNASGVVARRFCGSHPGFICHEYPFDVLPPGDARYFRAPARERCLDVYYNAVLAMVPRGAWVMKLDADQLYVTDALRPYLRVSYDRETQICFPRVQMVCRGGDAWVFGPRAVLNPCDQWILMHYGMFFTMDFTRRWGGPWEFLVLDRPVKKKHARLLIYHFPFQKDWRKENRELLTHLRRFRMWLPDCNDPHALTNEVPDKACRQ